MEVGVVASVARDVPLETNPVTPNVEMNWAAIAALVHQVPKTFRDPSFSHSGLSVSRVVTAPDPLGELQKVRGWQKQLEAIIDELVGTHHGSLTKSINNYAEIVGLFEANKKNVASLRSNLAESKRRLLTGQDNTKKSTRAPDELWRQTLVSRELGEKLAGLEALTGVGQKVRDLLAAKQYAAAVTAVLGANEKINATEYDAVAPALVDLSREIHATTELIRQKVRKEIGKIVFACDLECRRSSSSTITPTPKLENGCGFLSGQNLDTKHTQTNLAALISCVTRLGDQHRVFQSLLTCVFREVRVATQTQLLFCERNRDEIYLEIARAAAAAASVCEAPTTELFAFTLDVDDGKVSALQTPSELALDFVVAHLCGVCDAVLRNCETLDQELDSSSFRGSKTSNVSLSFAAAAANALRTTLPKVLRALVTTNPLCVGELGSEGSSGGNQSWWSVAEKKNEDAPEKTRVQTASHLLPADARPFVFSNSDATKSSSVSSDTYDFSQSVRVTGRSLRREFGWSATERIFGTEPVTNLLRRVESAVAKG